MYSHQKRAILYVVMGVFVILEAIIIQCDCYYVTLDHLLIKEGDRRPPKKPMVPAGVSPTSVRQCGARYAHFDALCGAWPSLCKEESCFVYLDRVSQPGKLDCIGWTCDPGCICDNGPEVAWEVFKSTYNKTYETDIEHNQQKWGFMANLRGIEYENNKNESKKLYGINENADILHGKSGLLNPFNPLNWFHSFFGR